MIVESPLNCAFVRLFMLAKLWASGGNPLPQWSVRPIAAGAWPVTELLIPDVQFLSFVETHY